MAPFSLDRPTNSESDGDLLHAYVERNSQAAFAVLVRRYLNFVYAACRREVRDADLAQDVAQAVFLVLARKAPSLRAEFSLAGWLLQTARLASREALRKERRRMYWEHQAAQEQASSQQPPALWEQTEPHLNDALFALNAKEREAILLRFFQGQSLRETGTALGLSEDAARMRIARSLDKIRHHLRKAGIVLSAAALSTLLLENSAQSAPESLFAALTQGHGAGTFSLALQSSRSHHLAEGALRAMKIMQWKVIALPIVGIVLVSGGLSLAKNSGALLGSPRASQTDNITLQSLRPNPPAGPTALPGTQLPANFTLVFDVMERSNQTPETLARLLRSVREGYDREVRQGKMTQAVADQSYKTASEGIINKPDQHHYQVTVSARDGRLLYRRDAVEAATDTSTGFNAVHLFDGQQSLQYFASDVGANIISGMNLWQMEGFPLPGLGLERVPLLQNADLKLAKPVSGSAERVIAGQVPAVGELQGMGNTPNVLYRAGQLRFRTIEGKPQVTQLIAGQGKDIGPQWDYFQHKQFAGAWLATRFRHTEYDIHGRAWRRMDFRLESADTTPLPASQFDFDTWLPANVNVTLFQNHGTRKFTYDPLKGGWEKQAADSAPGE